MENFVPRTDLAREAHAIAASEGALQGVIAREDYIKGFPVTRVEVTGEAASHLLCKPLGKYFTLDFEKLIKREENSFPDCVHALSQLIRELLGDVQSVLVVGLGNEAITPDAIGPWALDYILVTRHLKMHGYSEFEHFASVSALRPGVLGTTGLEAAAITELLAQELRPEAVIVIDALASAEPENLCKTVQITDTGIVPGSGVGNARAELSQNTLGLPVIAIGVHQLFPRRI